jgi:hypothetical protein
MAYQALTKNLQDANPYTYNVVNGATAPNGDDVALLYNQTITSREDLLQIVQQFVAILQTAAGTNFGP